jgi:hypothetical protein
MRRKTVYGTWVIQSMHETGFKVTAGLYLVNKKTRQKTRPQARLM